MAEIEYSSTEQALDLLEDTENFPKIILGLGLSKIKKKIWINKRISIVLNCSPLKKLHLLPKFVTVCLKPRQNRFLSVMFLRRPWSCFSSVFLIKQNSLVSSSRGMPSFEPFEAYIQIESQIKPNISCFSVFQKYFPG